MHGKDRWAYAARSKSWAKQDIKARQSKIIAIDDDWTMGEVVLQIASQCIVRTDFARRAFRFSAPHAHMELFAKNC